MRKKMKTNENFDPVRGQILVEKNVNLCCTTPYGVEYGFGNTFSTNMQCLTALVLDTKHFLLLTWIR